MVLNARQRRILDLAQTAGSVEIDALAAQFGVTPQTIRRDINQLCARELLVRYHGGAGLPTSVENLHYQVRQYAHAEEKRAIAAAVAAEIPPRASLFITIGTTTEAVAAALAHHSGLHVITNNLNVAQELASRDQIEVIVTGGTVRQRDKGLVGQQAVDTINQFRVDYAVIGISGIEPDGTLLDFDAREVRVAQAIIRNARRVFLAADHSKIGRPALVRVGHIGQVTKLFTDRPPPGDLAQVLREHGVAAHIARPA
ncbi:DeoR family transcriptional regulator [Rhodothalassium salexigens]|uniref:DeoR/GlpR family DNA-binding transcription regulator n=1 Tax=Rhodothalassium salexigens TaxID=1086 RepID=UPI0019121D13|nr:DeoR/GlpR family DNA-binding transcription regulator [Rhodothalassium salexigens]MBK5912279.1 DeoR family transcriptional regulator [Rhodothalassium salexigens]MBK5920299.1 DeoR family transcriptional regulator [Rhodothalassium salexigens]